MGLIAYYAGLYIMSNRLLLSLPVNEASDTWGKKKKRKQKLALKLLWFVNQTQAACCCLAVCHLPLEIILLRKIKFIGLNPKHSTLLTINFEICLFLNTKTIRCTVWRGDWTNLLSITFKADHSQILLLVKPGSSSSRLPIAVRGDSHENCCQRHLRPNWSTEERLLSVLSSSFNIKIHSSSDKISTNLFSVT